MQLMDQFQICHNVVHCIDFIVVFFCFFFAEQKKYVCNILVLTQRTLTTFNFVSGLFIQHMSETTGLSF